MGNKLKLFFSQQNNAFLKNSYWVTPHLASKSESSGLASQSVSVDDNSLSCNQLQGAHANG
jgi:hypothetical protein